MTSSGDYSDGSQEASSREDEEPPGSGYSTRRVSSSVSSIKSQSFQRRIWGTFYSNRAAQSAVTPQFRGESFLPAALICPSHTRRDPAKTSRLRSAPGYPSGIRAHATPHAESTCAIGAAGHRKTPRQAASIPIGDVGWLPFLLLKTLDGLHCRRTRP